MDVPPTQQCDLADLECAAPAVVAAIGVNGLRLLLRRGGDTLEQTLRSQMAVEKIGSQISADLSAERRTRAAEERARINWDLLSDGEQDGFLAVVSRINPFACTLVRHALDPTGNSHSL